LISLDKELNEIARPGMQPIIYKVNTELGAVFLSPKEGSVLSLALKVIGALLIAAGLFFGWQKFRKN
jgi:hypothetical protein